MRILFASSEAHPLMKTGGLGDVSASLPAAIRRKRQDIRVVIPAYPGAIQRMEATALPAPEGVPWTLLQGELPGTSVPVYLLDWPVFFRRDGNPYQAANGQDWPDNAHRFHAFSRVIATLALNQAGLDWQPDIVHLNDWQTGLAPVFLRDAPERPATVFTIHNLAYQGLFHQNFLTELGLPAALWHPDALEFYGQLSFMKGGLLYSDAITAVSPTYALEIQTPEFGMGLDGVLRARNRTLYGILNGIDTQEWNPARDPFLAAAYTAEHLEAKAVNKRALQDELQLAPEPDLPLIGHVGRMVAQKGTDLILEACAPFLAAGRIQLALIGSGHRELEQTAQALAKAYPHACATVIGYDEGLAHRIEAGADAFLMPSRFEPCGLNQMYSLRYGTPPIVHATGGLADTVIDATPFTLAQNTANGFSFHPATTLALTATLERVLALYHEPGRKRWQALMRRGMALDFSWNQSSKAYLELYRGLLASRSSA